MVKREKNIYVGTVVISTMASVMTEHLASLGLSDNPFRELDPRDREFDRLVVDRLKELLKLETALDFFKSGNLKNVVIIGESRIGKTTLIKKALHQFEELFSATYYPYPRPLKSFVRDFIGEDTGGMETLKDYGNTFLDAIFEGDKKSVVIIDHFEETTDFEKEELDEYIRLFRRAPVLFICATTPEEWKELVNSKAILKNVFSEEVYVEPFNMKHSLELIRERLGSHRVEGWEGEDDFHPFTKEAAKVLSIYAFFIPGRIVDLGNKLLFEAIAEEKEKIDGDFVKEVIFESPTLKPYIETLSGKQVEVVENMIEAQEPLSFSQLGERMGISRVAVAGHMQKLINMGFVEHIEQPGKKKFFRITGKFKMLIS